MMIKLYSRLLAVLAASFGFVFLSLIALARWGHDYRYVITEHKDVARAAESFGLMEPSQ